MKGRDAGDGGEDGFEEDEVDNVDKKRSAQFNAVRKEYIKKHLFRNSSIFIVYFKGSLDPTHLFLKSMSERIVSDIERL